MRERIAELLEDVVAERRRVRARGEARGRNEAYLVFRVLEEALRLALDSEVL